MDRVSVAREKYSTGDVSSYQQPHAIFAPFRYSKTPVVSERHIASRVQPVVRAELVTVTGEWRWVVVWVGGVARFLKCS